VNPKDDRHAMSASSGTASHPTTPLSTALTPLLGREMDLDGVSVLIDDPSKRLITVTGPGGVGKTRLALHVATTMIDEFERDVAYVPLASVREADLVLLTIGQALDLTFDANEAFEDQLVQAIVKRSRLLLVLDNFEQLLGAGPDIARLLARCPETSILVTSQTALSIPGEHLYPLPPLPTPAPVLTTAGAILRSDAVALFVARARAVRPALVVDDRLAVTIAEICRRLDGLPLAIELAAARTNILSPDALLARLTNRLQVLGGERRGVPERLRTMRHAIAWSYELLTPPERWLFRRMSVFAGGFSLDAVEAIFQPAEGGRGALVDHSLVQAMSLPTGASRFLMLETLREYGLEQLEQLGEADETRHAHATWVLDLAETAEPRMQGNDQEQWLNRLGPEWENIRAAMEWLLQSRREAIVLRTLSAIRRFCTARGHVSEAREFLDRALAAMGADQSVVRCRGLIAAGNLAEDQGDLDIAQALCTQARALAVDLGDKLSEAQALIGLGYVANDRGDYAMALAVHTQAATLAREIDAQHVLGTALGNLASVSYFQGKLDDAQRYWEEAGHIFKTLGDHLTEALAVGNLGAVATEQGEFDHAERLQQRALQLQRRLGNAPNIALVLVNLADICRHLGDFTLANDQLAEAIPILHQLGFKALEGIALNTLATVAYAQGDLERSASAMLHSMRLLSEVGDQISIVENIDLLANLCTARGDLGRATEFMAVAAAQRAHLGVTPRTIKQAELETLERTLRKTLDERSFERHWRAGAGFEFEILTRRISTVAREIAGPQQPQPVIARPEAPEPHHHLTAREFEVLRLLTQGRSTREISEALYISPRTATTHINNIFGKLEVSSRAAAVAYAMRAGMV